MNDELLKSRIKQLRSSSIDGDCVLYVMSRDQRVTDNHALLAAQKHALAKKLPLAVVFALHDKSGYRAREQYTFMLQGLKDVEKDLKKLNIPFMMVIGPPQERLRAVFHHTKPDAVYFDFNPLRGPQNLQKTLAKNVTGSTCHKMYVVDTHNVVPVWVTSPKFEIGAYTIRPKIHKLLGTYLVEPEQLVVHPYVWPGVIQPMRTLEPMIQEELMAIPENGTKLMWRSGEAAARKHLETFIAEKLERYAVDRNDPSNGAQSDLSPYLHFGQISSLRFALRLREESLRAGDDLHFISSPKMPKPENAKTTKQHGIDSLIEEMIVRKELADNFCYYNDNYDNIESAPKWARASLDAHRDDSREYIYSFEELRDAKTHDPAWNAAQRQLTTTGKMHGYMRMYWAKKVLEWSPVRPHNNGTPSDFSENFDMDGIAHTATRTKYSEEIQSCTHSERSKLIVEYFSQFYGAEWAIEVLKYLNDHYSIDGGDPNGYAGILWSVAGVHDRPWFERPIFGVIRYMNYEGLKRKFDIKHYEQNK